MKTFVKILLLCVIIGITAIRCERYKIETDPAKAILGKWEIIEMGNWPIMEPVTEPFGYREYLTDSILKEYEYTTGNIFIKKYWIDSLLHFGIVREDGFVITQNYKYTFFDEKLRLDLVNVFAIYNTFIYKRIK